MYVVTSHAINTTHPGKLKPSGKLHTHARVWQGDLASRIEVSCKDARVRCIHHHVCTCATRRILAITHMFYTCARKLSLCCMCLDVCIRSRFGPLLRSQHHTCLILAFQEAREPTRRITELTGINITFPREPVCQGWSTRQHHLHVIMLYTHPRSTKTTTESFFLQLPDPEAT